MSLSLRLILFSCYISAWFNISYFVLQGEKKAKKVCVLPGHLLTLKHCVEQEYFPVDQANVLEVFVSRLVHVFTELLTKVIVVFFSSLNQFYKSALFTVIIHVPLQPCDFVYV